MAKNKCPRGEVVVRHLGQRTCAFARGSRVYVWDDVATHYTTVHGLTAGQQRYVRARSTKHRV